MRTTRGIGGDVDAQGFIVEVTFVESGQVKGSLDAWYVKALRQ